MKSETTKATLDKNRDSIKLLEEFFASVWEDGKFLNWVNPKTQKLNVKDVANHILNTRDTSIFSKWAQPFRDAFNERYKKWRQTNGTADSGELEPPAASLGAQTPEVFIQKIMQSSIGKSLDELNRDALVRALNSYQTLTLGIFLSKISEMQERIKDLEAQIYRKNKKLVFQAEIIDLMKTAKVAEENHYLGSIRNLYSFDTVSDFEDTTE